MADRYFVGSYWNDAANWSTVSNGSGGASVPTNADNAIFDSYSPNSCVIWNNTTMACNNLDMSDYNGTLRLGVWNETVNPAGNLNVYGNFIVGSGLTVNSFELDTDLFDTWSAETEYNYVDFVKYDDIVYYSLQNNNLNHTPDSNPSWWKSEGNVHATEGNLRVYGEMSGNGATFDYVRIVSFGSVGEFESHTVTDVDSSHGLQIYSPNSTLTRTANWTTEEFPPVIEIYDATDLRNIEDNMSANYKLMNDIDLGSVDWKPIGVEPAPVIVFTGEFDGQGYTISNLYCSRAVTDLDGVGGLFSFLGNRTGGTSLGRGVIKNLTIENSVLEGEIYCAPIVGFIISGQVINCHTINVTLQPDPLDIMEGMDSCGGLVGWATSYSNLPSSIHNCSVNGVAIDTPNTLWCGGFIGYASNNGDLGEFIISSCYVDGLDMKSDYWSTENGGFCGYAYQIQFDKCYVKGDITLTLGNYDGNTWNFGGYLGGFIWANDGGNIYNCFSDVDISMAFSADNVDCEKIGGFVGVVANDTTIRNCYSAGDITITQTAGALEARSISNYTTYMYSDITFRGGQVSPLYYVEAIGGGAGGGIDDEGEGGGGGGAYSKILNFAITPGIPYTVSRGAGGLPGVNGGDTYFDSPTTVMAKGGTAGSGRNGGAGGQAASGVGSTKYDGGSGGTSTGASAGGGGGGGSAGSVGAGGNGAANSGSTGGAGGTWGGIPSYSGGAGGNNGINGVTQSSSRLGPGGGGGGAGATSGSGRAGTIRYNYDSEQIRGIGGFVGDQAYENTIENCFSVGVISIPAGWDVDCGGFLGCQRDVGLTATNCAVYSGSYAYAVGRIYNNTNKTMVEAGYGVEEDDVMVFQDDATHAVFAQGT